MIEIADTTNSEQRSLNKKAPNQNQKLKKMKLKVKMMKRWRKKK